MEMKRSFGRLLRMPNEDETGAQHRAPPTSALARDLGWANGSNDRKAVNAAEEQGSQPALTQTQELRRAGLA